MRSPWICLKTSFLMCFYLHFMYKIKSRIINKRHKSYYKLRDGRVVVSVKSMPWSFLQWSGSNLFHCSPWFTLWRDCLASFCSWLLTETWHWSSAGSISLHIFHWWWHWWEHIVNELKTRSSRLCGPILFVVFQG